MLPANIRELAAAQVDVVSDLVDGLSDADLAAPTRCAGWLAAHLLVHVRLGLAETAESFAEPAGPDEPAARHFTDTARAAAGISRRAPAGRFRIQGHVMQAEDILAMWTVEPVVHQLDLIAQLPGRHGPLPDALALTCLTLDGLLDTAERPPSWDDVTYVLKGTGRVPLDAADREFLGQGAAGFPAFG